MLWPKLGAFYAIAKLSWALLKENGEWVCRVYINYEAIIASLMP